jgi:diguanylate cyclase (GGDEF)-like protein
MSKMQKKAHLYFSPIQIKLIYDYALKSIPFNIFIALVAAFFLLSSVSLYKIIYFIISVVVISIARILTVKYVLFKANWEVDFRYYLGLFIIGNFLQGLAWGIWFVIFAFSISIESQYFLLLLISGLVSGSVSTLSSLTIAFYSYAIPMIVIPVLFYIFLWDIHVLPLISILLIFLFGISLSYFRTQNFIMNGINLNIENEKLISKLQSVNDFLEESNKKIKNISLHDPLTKLSNRRHFMETIYKEWFRHLRTESPLSVLMIDIDAFKKYNDHLGHQAGDQCLKQVSKAIVKNVKRAGDLAARYGGEEFICILSETPEENALLVAQSILNTIHEMKMTHPSSTISPYLTVSIGVAGIIPSQDSSYEKLIELADKRLYQAKAHGGDTIVSHS